MEMMYEKPLTGEKKHYHSGTQTVAQMSSSILLRVNYIFYLIDVLSTCSIFSY